MLLRPHLIDEGHQKFFLHGDGELAKFVKTFLRENFKDTSQILEEMTQDPDLVILNLTDSLLHGERKIINVLEYLRRQGASNNAWRAQCQPNGPDEPSNGPQTSSQNA